MPQNEKLLHSNYCHSFQKCFYEPTWSEKKKSSQKWENINFLSWSHNEKMFHIFLVSKQVISVFFCHDNLLRISFCNLLAKKHANHFSRNFEPFEENVHHFYYTMVEKFRKCSEWHEWLDFGQKIVHSWSSLRRLFNIHVACNFQRIGLKFHPLESTIYFLDFGYKIAKIGDSIIDFLAQCKKFYLSNVFYSSLCKIGLCKKFSMPKQRLLPKKTQMCPWLDGCAKISC